MARSRGVDAKLTRLHALRDAAASSDVAKELGAALADASNLVVATAAAIVGAQAIKELSNELVAAFERFLIDPETSDKQCRAKIAVVEALNKIEYADDGVFLRGIKHVQDRNWPPGSGQDAAGALRAHCAFGLTRVGHPDLLTYLTDLLLDSDRTARVGAARAPGGTGSLAVVPLLRFKTQQGDKDPEVIGECFGSLLTLAPAQSVPFVARFLRGRETVAEAAVFALAESRRSDAYAELERFWPACPEGLKESLLLGMATFRTQPAIDFLVGVIAGKDACARAAVSALAIHRHNDKIKDSVAAAIAAHGDEALQTWFKKKFLEPT